MTLLVHFCGATVSMLRMQRSNTIRLVNRDQQDLTWMKCLYIRPWLRWMK